MKVKFITKDLTAALLLAHGNMARKSTLPILSTVLLDCNGTDGRARLFATDLSSSTTIWTGADVLEPYAICVPPLFIDYINGLAANAKDAIVTVEVNKATLVATVTCGKRVATINCLDADDMPTPSRPSADAPTLQLTQVMLDEIVRTSICAATDDTRPVLAGVHITATDTKFTSAAADGFRLARRKLELTQAPAASMALIVPAPAFSTLSHVWKWSGVAEGQVQASQDVVMVTMGDAAQPLAQWVTRLIDGKFPDVDRVIPAQYHGRMIVNRKELMAAFNEVMLVAASSSNIVRMVFAETGLTMSGNAAEVGTITTDLDGIVHLADGPLTIAVNGTLARAIIGRMETDTLALELQTAMNPLVIRPVGLAQGEFVAVLMPMTVR